MGGSKTNASLVLFLSLNLLFFTYSSACGTCNNPNPTPTPSPKPYHKPSPKPNPSPSPSRATCPRDTLKLGVCAKLLGRLLDLQLGKPPKLPCCALIEGLVDLEAAVCLCTVIKADLLGIHLDIPLSLSLLLNVCGKQVPKGFQCA